MTEGQADIAGTVRPMTAADIPELSRWLPELPLGRRYRFTAEALDRNFRRALAGDDMLFVVDLGPEPSRDGTARGLAWCDPQGAFSRGAYLRLIALHPEQSGRGLGGRLLHHVESSVSGRSDDLFLLVSDFNTSAQRFYENRGYRRIGALPAFVLEDVTELIYRKRLDAGKEVTVPQPSP